MAESAVASVVRAFGTLAADEVAFLRGVHTQADLLKDELRRMQCFLRDADAKSRAGGHSGARITNWVVDVRAAAYDAENALEEAAFLAHYRERGCASILAWCANLVALHRFGVKIKRVRDRIREISVGTVAYGIADLGETSASADVQEQVVTPCDLGWNTRDGDSDVGFLEERNSIFQMLTDDDTGHICVVSVVGMAGSGKSTLAKKIYNDPLVKQHFQASSWVSVSEKYRFLDLIKDIARRIMGITRKKMVEKEEDQDGEGTSSAGKMEVTIEELEKMEEEDVRELLREFLAHRKFLLVLDDVWKSNSYSEINRILSVLPDANNGSRIILTTRDINVAKHVEKRCSIHEKKLLDDKESWELLEKRSFPEYRNVSLADQSRLMPIGKKLAVKCKGLPLALVVLGGYLSRNLDYDIWSGLISNLDWETRKDDEPIWYIIARSYNDLPNHQLKACFLYLASFPEDHVIRNLDFSRLRSMTVFGEWNQFFISKSMRLIRVLDLEDASGIKDEDVEKIVKWLRRLKFLSLRRCSEIHHLPSSVTNLRQLQSLDIRHTSIVTLPVNIGKLEKLQYIRAGAAVLASMPPASSSKFPKFCGCRRLVGVKVPREIGKLTVLHTLGVVNISASGREAIVKGLKKLTQLRKLGVSGINRNNSKEFLDATSGLVHLESLSMRLDKDNHGCLDDISLPWENLQSLKLYGFQEKLPLLTVEFLAKLRKLDLEISTLGQSDIEFLAKLPKLCILRLSVKQVQDGKIQFYAEMCGEQLATYEKVKILQIACSSSNLHVTFGSKSMKNLELLKIDCSSALYKLTGLNYLSELKQVLLKGATDEIKEELESRLLANHPKTPRPAVMLEEPPHSS